MWEKVLKRFMQNGCNMAYSGADVLAHLSELARQRAELPRISTILVLAQQRSTGDLIQSALRAVVGYEAEIIVAPTFEVAIRDLGKQQPQIVFLIDTAHQRAAYFGGLLQSFRKMGIHCPVAIALDVISPQLRCQLLDLGVLDVFHRDEICGLRLRECLLKLGAASSS